MHSIPPGPPLLPPLCLGDKGRQGDVRLLLPAELWIIKPFLSISRDLMALASIHQLSQVDFLDCKEGKIPDLHQTWWITMSLEYNQLFSHRNNKSLHSSISIVLMGLKIVTVTPKVILWARQWTNMSAMAPIHTKLSCSPSSNCWPHLPRECQCRCKKARSPEDPPRCQSQRCPNSAERLPSLPFCAILCHQAPETPLLGHKVQKASHKKNNKLQGLRSLPH